MTELATFQCLLTSKRVLFAGCTTVGQILPCAAEPTMTSLPRKSSEVRSFGRAIVVCPAGAGFQLARATGADHPLSAANQCKNSHRGPRESRVQHLRAVQCDSTRAVQMGWARSRFNSSAASTMPMSKCPGCQGRARRRTHRNPFPSEISPGASALVRTSRAARAGLDGEDQFPARCICKAKKCRIPSNCHQPFARRMVVTQFAEQHVEGDGPGALGGQFFNSRP